MQSIVLEGLLAQIAQDGSILSDFYTTSQAPQPSFSVNAPRIFPFGAPKDVTEARASLIQAAKQLQLLALGPTESLQSMALGGALDTASLRWIYHNDIAASVPLEGSISFSELATKTNVDERVAVRILRHAMTSSILHEPFPDYVAHTSLSRLLAEEGNPIRGVVGHQTEVVFPALAHMVDAHSRYGAGDDVAIHTGFNEAFRTEERALDWVAADPVRASRLAESMKGRAKSGQFSAAHTVSGFDWHSIGNGVIVDVGGSAGQVSIALCNAFPRLCCIVQDFPSVVAKGEAEIDPMLKDRISFQAHDFFQPQPVEAPVVFLLRFILHDWPDADAVKILRQLVPKMGPETRVLINDSIMPEPGEVDALTERRIRDVDMMMMAMFNGRERRRVDWEKLVKMADPRLHIANVVTPEGSAISMIEVTKSPD